MSPALTADESGRSPRPVNKMGDFQPRRKFKVEERAEDTGGEIEITAPVFSPRQKNGKGRPPNPVKFVIRPFDGGFGVWLVQPGERRKYCCHFDAAEARKVRHYDFAAFGEYVTARIRARQRTEQTAAKIDALLSLIPQLVIQSRQGRGGA